MGKKIVLLSDNLRMQTGIFKLSGHFNDNLAQKLSDDLFI